METRFDTSLTKLSTTAHEQRGLLALFVEPSGTSSVRQVPQEIIDPRILGTVSRTIASALKYWLDPQHGELAAFAAVLAGDSELVDRCFAFSAPTKSSQPSTARGSRKASTNSAMVHSFKPPRMLSQMLPIVVFESKLFQQDIDLDPFTAWLRERMMWIASLGWSIQNDLDATHADSTMIHCLLQDIGMLCIQRAYTKRYLIYWARWRTGREHSLHRVERQLFGYTHADVTAAMMDQWKFPPELANLIQDHHRSDRIERHLGLPRQIIRVGRLAESLADLGEFSDAERQTRVKRDAAELNIDLQSLSGGIYQRAVDYLRQLGDRSGIDCPIPKPIKL